MWGRGLCAVAGRLHYPPTPSRGFRYLTNHPPAANNLAIGINSGRISHGNILASFRSTPMTTRILHSTKATNGEKHRTVDKVHDHEPHDSRNHSHTTAHDHEDHNNNHSHSHSHGIFGAFGHTHSREDTTTAGAEKIVEALKGGSAYWHRSVELLVLTWHKPNRCRPRKSGHTCRIVRQYHPYRYEGPGGVVYGMFTSYMLV